MKRRRARTCFCPYRACGLFMAGPRPLCGAISALPRIPRRQAALRRSANVRFAACAEHHGVAGGAATAAHAACSRLHRDRRAGRPGTMRRPGTGKVEGSTAGVRAANHLSACRRPQTTAYFRRHNVPFSSPAPPRPLSLALLQSKPLEFRSFNIPSFGLESRPALRPHSRS